MVEFLNVEEEYCILCSHNVAIEKHHLVDGSVQNKCLHKSCCKDHNKFDGPECYKHYEKY